MSDPPAHACKSLAAVLHAQLAPLLRNEEAESAAVRQPLYHAYKELQLEVRLVLDSKQPDARVVLQNPYTFVADLQDKGSIQPVIATPALRAIVALASSASAESGMSRVTDMDSDRRQSTQAKIWLSEIFLRYLALPCVRQARAARVCAHLCNRATPENEDAAQQAAAKRPALGAVAQ